MGASKYMLDRAPFGREMHVDPSMGFLADSFGAPKDSMIDAESELTLRDTSLSKCGQSNARRASAAETHQALQARQEPLPRAEGAAMTPQTMYMHRLRKGCQPVYGITHDRIADPSILPQDPFASVRDDYYYWIPQDTDLLQKDLYQPCMRAGPSKPVAELPSAYGRGHVAMIQQQQQQ